MRLEVGVVGALVGAIGCGGGGGSATGPQVVQGAVDNAVVSLPVSIDAIAAMPFVVDTGAPLTLIDPTKFPSSGLQPGASQVSTLQVGTAVHVTNVEVVSASPCGVMVCSGSQPAGLLGGNVLSTYAVTIDYRAGTVGFDATTIPSGVGAPATTAFVLAGGGSITVPGTDMHITVPPTRIALDVTIEGVSHPFVLDTGSSTMVLKAELYDALVADGRAQGNVQVSTLAGTKSEPSTQLHQVEVAGAAEANVLAVRSPLDLTVLSVEVGHNVDGLLGGAYLDSFVVTIDYPARQITLRPYTR
jgi:hypothetical protein